MPDVVEPIKDLFKEISNDNDSTYFFWTKYLHEFIPFEDGFEFKDEFVLKINEFHDFKERYEECLLQKGLIKKYNPQFYGYMN